MIRRELRRFFRSNLVLGISGILVFAIGIGASAVTLSLLIAYSSPTYPGIQQQGYASIAEETDDGGAMPISWDRFEELRSATHGGVRVAAYSSPITAVLVSASESRQIKLAAVSSGFFTGFASRLAVGNDFTSSEEQTP